MRINNRIKISVIVGLILAGSISAEGIRTIEVILQKSYYSPERINLTKGETVRLVLKSMDVTHGFAIDELGIAREVAPGPPVVIEYTASRVGTFTYYCVVRCGKGHLKMRGTLVVGE